MEIDPTFLHGKKKNHLTGMFSLRTESGEGRVRMDRKGKGRIAGLEVEAESILWEGRGGGGGYTTLRRDATAGAETYGFPKSVLRKLAFLVVLDFCLL
jgi:hypothetical protein